MSRFQRVTASMVAFSLLTTGMWMPAQAASIDMQAVLQQEAGHHADVSHARQVIDSALQRADLQQALASKGIAAADIQVRVNGLTDEEVVQLGRDIEQAPAGAGDIVGALVFIFVLLLVTDILGLTKVFPFTRSLRR